MTLRHKHIVVWYTRIGQCTFEVVVVICIRVSQCYLLVDSVVQHGLKTKETRSRATPTPTLFVPNKR